MFYFQLFFKFISSNFNFSRINIIARLFLYKEVFKIGIKNDTLFFYSRSMSYFEFSNMYHSPFEYGGRWYRTIENFYNSQMFVDAGKKESIRTAATPLLARRYTREYLSDPNIKVREDWEEVKFDILYDGLKAKFTQNIKLRDLLLSTGEIKISEKSDDKFWGYKGDDVLGRFLMKLRDELVKI